MASPLSTDMTLSRELRQIFSQATEMAHAARQPLYTTHLLICVFTTESAACALLRERGVRLDHLSQLSRTTLVENQRVLESVVSRMEQLGLQTSASELNSLHLLATLTSEPRSQAYRALDAVGLNLIDTHKEATDRLQWAAAEESLMDQPQQRQLLGRASRSTPEQGLYALGLSEASAGSQQVVYSSSSHAMSQVRERNRERLKERSAPVHPALHDSWLRTTPSGGTPALSRQQIQQHQQEQRVERQRTRLQECATPLPIQPQPLDLRAPLHTLFNDHTPMPQAIAGGSEPLLAQATELEAPLSLPDPSRKTLKERFAERKAEIRRRSQPAKSTTPKPPTPPQAKTPPPPPTEAPKRPEPVTAQPTPQQPEDDHVFILPSTRRPLPPLNHEANLGAGPSSPPSKPPKDRGRQDDQAPSSSQRPEAKSPLKDEAQDQPTTSQPEAKAPSERSQEVHKDEAIADARATTRSLASRLFAKRKNNDDETQEAPVKAPTPAKEDAPGEQTLDEARETIAIEPAARRPDPVLATHYRLDPEEFPLLARHGRNITEEAALMRIDPVVGRDQEITQVIDILGKRRGNNPLLIGDPGVGKTAIVEGLAHRFVQLAKKGNRMGQRAIIELEVGRILSGTHLRGSFSERLIAIKDEVRKAEGRIIIFLDEIHAWMSAGQGGDGADATSELKTALARGHFPCIGATTNDEFSRFIETDPAFERRFQIVHIEEPCLQTSITIARGVRPQYEQHHGVHISDEAIEAAVKLSHRYIRERQLPDKALNVLDMAASKAARHSLDKITREDIAKVVAEMSSLPIDRLTRSDGERFLDMERELAQVVIGHEDVIHTVSEVLRRNYAGFRSQRPIGSLLFLGPTGVGKTEMVKALAGFLFHDREAIVRMDMSEFMEAHSVSRLIGAPPGYIGYDQGGQLTEAIRRSPYQVVLLDEIEKAHPDILNILLQVLDEGRLTDGKGRVVDFSNALIVMTSNLGAQRFDELIVDEPKARIGFGGAGNSSHAPGLERRSDSDKAKLREAVLGSAREHFPAELWARIEERLVFMPLERDEVASIADLLLKGSMSRLRDESLIAVEYDRAVIELLIDAGGFEPKHGARPMRQTIQRLIESNLARLILSNKVAKGDTIIISVQRGELHFTRRKRA